MYLNFFFVDSKDEDQTEEKFCCSCNETVHLREFHNKVPPSVTK